MARSKRAMKALQRLASVALVAGLGGLLLWWARAEAPRSREVPSEQASFPPADDAELPAQPSPEPAWSPCHNEALTASDVPVRSVEGRPTDVRGGALRDGVYDVADYQVFGRPPGQALSSTFRQTMVIEDQGAIAKNIRIGRTGRVETTIWATSVRGAVLTLVGVCPAAVKDSSETVEFDAHGDELVMSFEQAGLPVRVTYRRRAG